MRETQFIRDNQDKWQDFERVLEGEQRDPDRLSELLLQVTDDLSYSRTAYPNRTVRLYLNGLAQSIFLRIYRHRPAPWRRIWAFWRFELPGVVYESRMALRLSAAVFFLSFFIGLVSCAMDPEFVRVVLGDAYVDMTNANIESGDPMAVYKQAGEFDMFLGITINNLLVAFLTFAMGVLFGLGSLAILIRNGVMLGAFQYFFIEKGLFWESFLTVWIHGTLEISAIVLAGGAGLTMGRGLAFPETYTRMQAFQQSGRQGIKLMVGIMPLFVVAGFLEGYLTRHTDTPDGVRGFFILSCLAFVLAYFSWYPRRLAGQVAGGLRPSGEQQRRLPDRPRHIVLQRVKHAGQVFSEAFSLLLGGYTALWWWLPLAAAAFAAAAVWPAGAPPESWAYLGSGQFWSGLINALEVFAPARSHVWLPPVAAVLLTTLAWVIFRRFDELGPPAAEGSWSAMLLPGALMAGLPALWPGLALATLWLLGPVLMLWMYAAYRLGGLRAPGQALSLLRGFYGRALALQSMLLLPGLLLGLFFDTLGLDMVFTWVSWLVSAPQATLDQWSVTLMGMLSALVFFIIWSWLVVAWALQYHVLLEIREAPGLRRQLADLGVKKNIRGLEKE